MYSRWYEITVVLLWLVTMSWLVTQKVLPSLWVGDPPDVSASLKDVPDGWSIAWNDRPLGWALSTTLSLPDGSTKIRSQVHFDELPLSEMIPTGLRVLLKPLVPMDELEDQLDLETRNILIFSPEGQLSQFQSVVRFEPTVDAIDVRGAIVGSMLSVAVAIGELSYETEVPMPPKAMVSDALTPESHLPDLYQGQTWTVKLYSPFRPPNSPLEIVHAEVEGIEPMSWNGRVVDTWLVTYRAEPGWMFGTPGKPRTKLWVHPDGDVLKQQSTALGSTMTFTRLSDEEASKLADEVLEPEEITWERGQGETT